MKKEKQERRRRFRLWLIAAVCVASAALWGVTRHGYFIRHLNPAEWPLLARGVYRSDPQRGIVRQGPANVPAVALTFDDGPGGTTEDLLRILKDHNAKATFFLVGMNVKQRPELARRIVAEGHQVASHSRSHPDMTTLRDDQIPKELAAASYILARDAGVRVRAFRPPGGQYDERVLRAAKEQGLLTVLWSNNTGDYTVKDPAWITRRTLSNVQNGDIILLHENQQHTVQALPAILEGLESKGYRAVTVDELLAPR